MMSLEWNVLACYKFCEGNASCGPSSHIDHIVGVVQEMSGPRKFMTADGEVKFGNAVRLSEFLSRLHL